MKRMEDIMRKREEKGTRRFRHRLGHRLTAGMTALLLLTMTACAGSSPDGMKTSAYQSVTNGMSQDAAEAPAAEYGYESSYEDSRADLTDSAMTEETSRVATPSTGTDNSAYFEQRKLIKTVSLDVETREFDDMLSSIETQVETLGGYIESMNTYNGRYDRSDTSRSSSITARIPRDRLSGFVDAVSEAGHVTSRSENVEDVTLSYVDMESRKKSLETEQERLLALLENAEDLDAILTIEDRLSTVRYQLESMESQLRTYDNKVDFSTVYLNIREVKELTPLEEEEGFGDQILHGFLDSLEDVRDGLLDFVVWFVVHIPYLIVWVLIILFIVLIFRLTVRLIRKKVRKKREAKQQKLQAVQGGAGKTDAPLETNN